MRHPVIVRWWGWAVVAVLLAGCVSDPVRPQGAATAAPTAPTWSTSNTNATTSGTPSNVTQRPPERIAAGHIVVAGPYTRIRSLAVLGVPDVDGFFFRPPPAGSNLTTLTKDNRGLGYDLDLNFHDANGGWLGGCSTPARDEFCQVPAGAARGEVTAYMAVDVDVQVYRVFGNQTTVP